MFTNKSSTDLHELAVSKELNQLVGKALVQIPIDYRMVFSLRELNGMSTAETAEALGITETNVKARLNRSKTMLRKLIEKMYSPEEVFEFNLIYCDKITNHVMGTIKHL